MPSQQPAVSIHHTFSSCSLISYPSSSFYSSHISYLVNLLTHLRLPLRHNLINHFVKIMNEQNRIYAENVTATGIYVASLFCAWLFMFGTRYLDAIYDKVSDLS